MGLAFVVAVALVVAGLALFVAIALEVAGLAVFVAVALEVADLALFVAVALVVALALFVAVVLVVVGLALLVAIALVVAGLAFGRDLLCLFMGRSPFIAPRVRLGASLRRHPAWRPAFSSHLGIRLRRICRVWAAPNPLVVVCRAKPDKLLADGLTEIEYSASRFSR
jgi:hypothetical protein